MNKIEALLLAAVAVIGYGVLPSPEFTAVGMGIWLFQLLLVAMVFGFAIPGIGEDISDRLEHFGNKTVAITGALYTLPITALTWKVTFDLCLSNYHSFYTSVAIALLATVLAALAAGCNAYDTVKGNLASARNRAVHR